MNNTSLSPLIVDESKRIVLVLGNGFDLDLGLKTSYRDFWESEFCPKDYPAPLIRYLNGHFQDNLDSVRWYDLENELHNYGMMKYRMDVLTQEEREYLLSHSDYELTLSIRYTGKSEFLSNLEAKGLVKVQGVFQSVSVPYREDLPDSVPVRDRKALKHIKEGLCSYLKSIEFGSYRENSLSNYVIRSMENSIAVKNDVSIFSFNFTRLPARELERHAKVSYMHGRCDDEKIIIGTRDDLQLDNDYDFLQKVMDPAFNPPDIVHALEEADEVLFFGHSLGENDSQYFADFFIKQANISSFAKKSITIFTKDDESELGIKRSLQKLTGGHLSFLYALNQPKIIKSDCLEQDQQRLYDFLINHHFDKHTTEEIIGNLITAPITG